VRDRSNVQLLENCLRITIGTEQENTLLVDAWAVWVTATYQLDAFEN
jgi:histidinol-phosphate aminotransferase